MTPRPIEELKYHTRTLRWIMRAMVAVHAALLMIHVWDGAWPWAIWSAAVLALAASVARDTTRTLGRLR